MKIRFTLDDQIDAALIQKILTRAGEKSPSIALRAMVCEWSHFEDMTLKRQESDILTSHSRQDDEINLNCLDDLELEIK